jgi:hypothetical protein
MWQAFAQTVFSILADDIADFHFLYHRAQVLFTSFLFQRNLRRTGLVYITGCVLYENSECFTARNTDYSDVQQH